MSQYEQKEIVILAPCIGNGTQRFPDFGVCGTCLGHPRKMLDNPIVRALAYTGYNVQKQKDNGTIYQTGHYGGALKTMHRVSSRIFITALRLRVRKRFPTPRP